jgi:hypothetical protein
MTIRIDHFCLVDLGNTFFKMVEMRVNMTVNKEPGLMSGYQGMKTIKTFVAAVLGVMNMSGRRM